MPRGESVAASFVGSSSKSSGGRWFLVAVGLSLALIGGIFVWLMARSFLRARDMHAWPQVPCEVISADLTERRHDPQSPREFRLDVVYGYEWQGKRLTSDRFSLRGSPWTSKMNLAESRLQEFPVGRRTVCWVNPHIPEYAVLKPDSLAPGYSIWFPSLFVVGGLVMAIRALFDRRGASVSS